MNTQNLYWLLSLAVITHALPIQDVTVPVTNNVELPQIVPQVEVQNVTVSNTTSVTRNTIRPGMQVNSISVVLTPNLNTGTFAGSALISIQIQDSTREDDVNFHVGDLRINSVQYAIGGSTTFITSTFTIDDNLLVISNIQSSLYTFIIQYEGDLTPATGLFMGSFGDSNYVGMNLSPTNARRVFPCVDELTENPQISIEINGLEYNRRISNTITDANNENLFRGLNGPPVRWAFFGHSFNDYATSASRVILSGRPPLSSGQESLGSLAISSIYNFINEWTDKPYEEVLVNQNENMHVIAVPDVSVEWNSLSIVGVWEPYILMEQQHPVKQRQEGLVKIAEAMTRPWFGYILYPQNWIYQWVITGFSTYLAYEAVKNFQDFSNNPAALDYDTLFVTDVIHESLRLDAYRSNTLLEPSAMLYEEDEIRDHINGLLKYKAPAVMSTARLSLNENTDFIQVAAQGLFVTRSLDTITSSNFRDTIAGQWTPTDFNNLEDFFTPYLSARGCPLLTVNFQSGLLTISRSTFTYAGTSSGANFFIPISYTTSVAPNFNNIYPSQVYHQPTTLELSIALDDDDWILFNIQGQGYYRVQYNIDMWERIIDALEDDQRRAVIHPLNRATLVDDALNLARRIVSGLDYDIAFRVVLSMSNEIDYPVWKAFVRNMGFLKKRLEAMIEEDDDLDQDIYLRLVRRTIGRVEEELSFTPELNVNEPAMTTLTRALVMDHACRAGYGPCIAAAVDWFYGTNDEVVNPDIPMDLKPAVYCAVVRDGDSDVRDALFQLLNNSQRTRTMYDRIVILESLACSQDDAFIRSYLAETIALNSPYSIEEKSRIFAAVAGSSYSNAREALVFLRTQTNLIRESYGGDAKLENLIFVLAENMVNNDLATDFQTWVTNNNNNLGNSELAARRALEVILEDLEWNTRHLNNVYEWIDENDAPTLAISMVLLCLTALVALFN